MLHDCALCALLPAISGASDLNVNFVCLSVMDGPSTYRKSLLALILHVLCHALIQNHSSDSKT